MANETTTTTTSGMINTEVLEEAALATLMDRAVTDQFTREVDLRGRGGEKWQGWSITSDAGTPSDAGAGVDTEYDATENTALSNVQLDISTVTVTAASEYGIAREITDDVLEDGISGEDFMQMVMDDTAAILQLAFEDDLCSLFASFNGGTAHTLPGSGNDLRLQDLGTAAAKVREFGNRAPGGLFFVLDSQAASDVEEDAGGVGSSTARYDAIADRFLNVQGDPNLGLVNGFVMSFRNQPVVSTGVTDTANMAADVVSFCGVRGDIPANRSYAAIVKTIKRAFRIRTDRDELNRSTIVVATMRQGSGEQNDKSGIPLESDA